MAAPLVVSEDPVSAAVAPPLLVSQNFVEPVPVTTAPVPDLRRSSRLRTAAIPGAHRSYVGSTALSVSDPSMWTSVAGNKKTNAFLRRQPCSSSALSPPLLVSGDFTVATHTVNDMTIYDAISYLSSMSSHAYAAADVLKPQASTKCVERTLKQALQPHFAVAQSIVHHAVCKHLDMLTEELSTISLVSPTDIQPDCIRVYAQILIKVKADDRVTARLAAGGNRQPLSSHGETFAPTASESSSNLLLSTYQAFGKQQQLPIHTHVFDLSNAFQNTPLDKVNFPQQIIMLMPNDLPGKYASFSGQWVEVHKAINGLRQANELFDKDVRSQMHLAGFVETCDPCVYHKQDPTNASLKCSINMHVDDGLSVDTSHQFYQDAVSQLTMRWGTLKHQDGVNILYNGKNIICHPNGAISLSMQSYITRAAKDLGVAHLPPIGTPSNADFFCTSVNTTPVCPKLFARFNGCLTHVTTKGRFDVRKESQYLSQHMTSPDEDDMRKMIQVWQYLNCTSSRGPTYDTDEGAVLVMHVDAAFAVHADGTSHTGAYFSIGRYNAPIWVMSKPQADVALSPQASEYFGLSDPCQSLLWHRQLLFDLGFPQDRTVIWEDNIPAINLAYAPQITRKARYMFVRHHFVRSLVQRKLIKICHVDTKEQAADLLTHSLKPAQFKRHLFRLFNVRSRPLS